MFKSATAALTITTAVLTTAVAGGSAPTFMCIFLPWVCMS